MKTNPGKDLRCKLYFTLCSCACACMCICACFRLQEDKKHLIFISRIRKEVQQVAGEEFHVWRWLPNNSLNKSPVQNMNLNKKTKMWQGQAFDTMEGSVNSLPCSPTPCLKIRSMFDPDM